MKTSSFTLAIAALIAASLQDADACTAIVLDGKAVQGGYPTISTNGDAADGDWRLAKVPAAQYETGALRPVYEIYQYYPHTVNSARSATWAKDNLEDVPQAVNWTEAEPIGYIPQVKETYGLLETGLGYALINEKQVATGESSCHSPFVAKPINKGGKALFDVGALTMVALERAKTAREAIQIMGDLAEEYGYYGAEYDGPEAFAKDESGEAIPVADTTEAYMFHILPDPTGASAIWAAQRIPDGHVSLSANAFVIRGIKKDHPDFMYSKNLFSVAKEQKFWKESDGDLDFAWVYGSAKMHSEYSLRRVWRVFSKLAPSLKLTPDSPLPFSVPVDTEVSLSDVMELTRDHYEGTEFDLTKGVSAGPYGDPDRYDQHAVEGLTRAEVKKGHAYERAISLYRTNYAYVASGRADLPDHIGSLLWYVPHQPSDGAYVPVYTASTELPTALTVGSHFRHRSDALWWKYCLVSNWAHKYYTHIMRTIVRPEIDRLEEDVFKATAKAEKKALKLWEVDARDETVAHLTETTTKLVNGVASAWDELFQRLVVAYHDGFHLEDPNGARVNVTSIFYPKEWLFNTGFFAKSPETNDKHMISLGWLAVSVALAACVAAVAGYAVAAHRGKKQGYHAI
ncbi:hypothetical protein SARC_11120 [Sphaeroforma arctica JP610]|uniref:Dipeptidase n=1 Tax=Sphaeroforma arctica JP610 TaxID=667725 RepID=A0A0L0FK03_9EUKA|nr:hypothetical protein SARC_11120 [Sphaeroforma arctica JP610]KNC76378.1 hypothetical protein SARC_11120 [Sphaeroforma arctica JP610]|eukprot:XP_014150280.1 hypothetical protein SARC_11120 [Sphaeroforma arctica JP610]